MYRENLDRYKTMTKASSQHRKMVLSTSQSVKVAAASQDAKRRRLTSKSTPASAGDSDDELGMPVEVFVNKDVQEPGNMSKSNSEQVAPPLRTPQDLYYH